MDLGAARLSTRVLFKQELDIVLIPSIKYRRNVNYPNKLSMYDCKHHQAFPIPLCPVSSRWTVGGASLSFYRGHTGDGVLRFQCPRRPRYHLRVSQS